MRSPSNVALFAVIAVAGLHCAASTPEFDGDEGDVTDSSEERLGLGLPKLNDPYLIDEPAAGHQSEPSIARDGKGNLHIAYTTKKSSGWSSNLAKYDAAKGTWTHKELWKYGGYHPVVRVDRHRGVHVMLSSYDRVKAGAYFFSSDDGATFVQKDVVRDLAIGGDCDMAIDASDRPHIVCSIEDNYKKGPLYVTRRGTTWSTELLGDVGGLGVFAKHANARIAVWNAPDGTAQPRLLGTKGQYAFWNGNHWVAETIAPASLYTGNFGERTSTNISVSAADKVRIMFYREYDHKVYTGERTKTGWVTRNTGIQIPSYSASGKGVSSYLSGVTDSYGRFVGAVGGDASSASGLDGGLRVLRLDGDTWTQKRLNNLGGEEPRALVVGKSLYVAYSGRGPGLDESLVFARIMR